jgi:8-oxo-dGTP pyrophosphatase MutT (NUDIX family)
MNFESFLQSVSKIEQIPLPGQDSQLKMSPPFRLELIEQQREAMKTSKKAAVTALFYPDEKQVTKLILILRKTYKGVHSAQVGFPGGRREDSDESLKHAALRETWEEVGVPIADIEVLKVMTELYIPPSNFTVYPFFGVTHKTPMFVKQDDEVEDLIEVLLTDFLDELAVTSVKVMTSLEKELEVPAFLLNGHIVWGATAMMLSELKDLLKTVL